MTYTNETQRLLNAIITGDCCSDCNAPNGDRHFDECPQHPESQPPSELIARAKAALEGVTEGPWVHSKQHEARGSRDKGWIYPGNIVSDATAQIVFTQTGNTANGQFIAAARTLVPELIAELERRPLVPITDDLASERLDGVRDERDEALVRVDELTEERDLWRNKALGGGQ